MPVSDITPSYAIPHDNAIAQAIGEAGAAAQDTVNGLIQRHYVERGRAEGAAVAAGTEAYKKHIVLTDVGRAREAAFHGAYIAGMKTDIDTQIDDAARANPVNPDGFKKLADPLIAGFTKTATGPYAVEIQAYARERMSRHYATLADDKVQHDQAVAVNSVNARQQSLSDAMLTMAGGGQEGSPAYAAAHAEWTANEAAKVANPLFTYSPEQAALASEKQVDQLQGAALTYHATTAYNGAGGGEAGKAAALALLKREALDEGGALSEMPPGKRLKLYGAASAAVSAMDRDDAERRRQAADLERQAHADRVSAAGEFALGLTDGSETEASVRKAEADGVIEAGGAARLINSARAQQRRQAAEGRAAASLERTANYGAMMEMAASGELTAATLAANGANLSAVQRMALRGKIDRQIKPGVANITRLVAASFRDGGIQGTAAEMALQNLEVDAVRFMQNNPHAEVGNQQAFAAEWVKKTKGLVIAKPGAPAAAQAQTKDQFAAALRAKFRGQTITQGEIDKQWARRQANNPR